MMDDDFSLALILFNNPQTWSADDVQTVCQNFIQACDDERTPVSRLLTTQLWRYWFLKHSEEPLMPDPKYNMALMLGAKAFGEFVPPPGDREFFGRYRQEHAQFEATLAPPPLTWGPRASMNDISGPTLGSAVTHARIFRANGQIQEILIVGESVTGLQQEIFQAVFSCALRVQAGDLDMINADAYRIVAPSSDQEVFDLPGIATLSSASSFTTPNDKTVADILSELVQKLRLLQEQSGLVVVHECDVQVKQEFDRELRQHARDTFHNENVRIVAKDLNKSSELENLLTLAPYLQIARRPVPLRIVLHPDILMVPSFKELLEVFTYRTVERISADASVRQATYEEHVKQLKKEQKRWHKASKRMRKELWDEFVWLTEIFNGDTGTIIRLAQPIQRPTTEYMEKNVPSLIVQYETWAERMRKIIRDIQEATERPDTPIRRLAASRFLDIALRERGDLIQDETIRRYFDRWSTQITPLLRHQWRATLEAKDINPRTVFTPHTVFHTRFQVDDHNEIVGLIMQPFAMISPHHSVIVFDPEQSAMVSYTPSNYAQAFEPETDRDPDELWQKLEQTITESETDQEAFATKLQSMLMKAPFELLPKIIEYLAPSENPDIKNQWGEDQLIREHAELSHDIHNVAFSSKIITLLSHRALHSARKLIQDVQVSQDLQVYLILWQILVECITNNLSAIELIPNLVRQGSQPTDLFAPPGSDQILQLLRRAMHYDGPFVQEWVKRLENSEDLQLAVNLLRRNWMRLEEYLSTPQRQALYKAQSAVESAFLARTLEKAAQAIVSDGESTSLVLAKIGQSLADLLLTETGATPYSDVTSLLEILVEEESTSY